MSGGKFAGSQTPSPSNLSIIILNQKEQLSFLAPEGRVPGQSVELRVHLRESTELLRFQIAENLNPHLL